MSAVMNFAPGGYRYLPSVRMQRKSIAVLGAKLSPCVIAMEACCGAHHLGRVLSTLGHTVPLMSPEYVRPYGTEER
jgi:transposase